MNTLKIVAGIGILSSLLLATFMQHQALHKMREENQRLKQKASQLLHSKKESQSAELKAPAKTSLPTDQKELLKLRGEFSALRREKEDLGKLQDENRRLRVKWFEELLGGGKLTIQHVEPYLAAKQRNAESLLAASRATEDLGLLKEALAKFPNDPKVSFAALFALKNDLSPQDRQQLLESFKQSASDNALGNYLSALNYFKTGQTDLAADQLVAASRKNKMEDYSGAFFQNAEEAYRAAGFSEIESKTLAAGSMQLPQLAELRALGKNVADLYVQYKQVGDNDSALAAAQMGINLCRQLSKPAGQSSIISDMVSISIERELLGKMDPSSAYDTSGRTVKDRLDDLNKRRETIKQITSDDSYESLKKLSEQDQIAFYERMKTSGEFAALQWLKARK